MHKIFFISVFISAFPLFAWTHGENIPGPHGGHIQMPGDFHTELLLKKNQIHIYLLDLRIENPVTADSTVQLEIFNLKNKNQINCIPNKTFFSCVLPKNISLNSGHITVKAKRQGTKEAKAIYKFPLPTFSKIVKENPHNMPHH